MKRCRGKVHTHAYELKRDEMGTQRLCLDPLNASIGLRSCLEVKLEEGHDLLLVIFKAVEKHPEEYARDSWFEELNRDLRATINCQESSSGSERESWPVSASQLESLFCAVATDFRCSYVVMTVEGDYAPERRGNAIDLVAENLKNRMCLEWRDERHREFPTAVARILPHWGRAW